MNVVVSGGGTVAPVDEVRALTNTSTGRFSAAITEALLARGATVWHLHTAAAERPFARSARFDLEAADPAAEHARLDALRLAYQGVRHRLHRVPAGTGVASYAAALRGLVEDRPIDLIVLAMAVADYEPVPVPGKLESAGDRLTIEARRTPKVIRQVRDWAPDAVLVGFKLLAGVTTDHLIRVAAAACRENRADLTVANDLTTVREGRHTIHLVQPDRPAETLGPSPTLAADLVARLVELVERRSPPGPRTP